MPPECGREDVLHGRIFFRGPPLFGFACAGCGAHSPDPRGRPRMELALVNSDLEAARMGDRRALERVLTSSRQNLRRYAEFHCIINDVEDAVQESLLLVSRKLCDLRELECFTSWLFRIVKRECN